MNTQTHQIAVPVRRSCVCVCFFFAVIRIGGAIVCIIAHSIVLNFNIVYMDDKLFIFICVEIVCIKLIATTQIYCPLLSFYLLHANTLYDPIHHRWVTMAMRCDAPYKMRAMRLFSLSTGSPTKNLFDPTNNQNKHKNEPTIDCVVRAIFK